MSGSPTVWEWNRHDSALADYAERNPAHAGVRLAMLMFGEPYLRKQARKSLLREVPNLLRDYSGDRGPVPYEPPVHGILRAIIRGQVGR